ncbi:MAG TPA: thiamine pyrophosphate-binding protein [Xanthobacteraceae bacterium]|nr:thiamine pyrophosphate-binding protein [Xanthobacteraceae bacterium]
MERVRIPRAQGKLHGKSHGHSVRAVDVMLSVLLDEGVTHIFGNPGSTEMPLMDALVDHTEFTYVLGLQEATAVGMADGYALKTGRPAFVNLHAAGGLGNAMGVLVASKASETPLVVTAGQQDTRHLFSDPWLSGDLVSLARPIAKWAVEVRRGEDLGPALRRAFAIARTPPEGPVFLSLPMDVLEEKVEWRIPPQSAMPGRTVAAGVERLARLLAGRPADKVAILIGDDVPANAAKGALALSHAGGYVVYGTQVTSRSAFPADDPCWGGILRPDFKLIRETLEGMEAVLLIGGRAFVAYPYRDAVPIPKGTRFYHLASTREAIGREFPADFALTGDIAETLEALAAALAPQVNKVAVTARRKALAHKRNERAREVRALIARQTGRPLATDAAVLAVLDALPRETLIANDSAATFGLVQEVMKTYPGLYFFARGGVLGCSMPAAVGASLAHDGPVACLVGDGGAMYSPQALWSAAHYNTHTMFVVFNNARYNVLMNVARDLGCFNANADRFIGMDIVNPRIDYQALAASMGVPSMLAETVPEIGAAIRQGLEERGPTLIEIPIA